MWRPEHDPTVPIRSSSIELVPPLLLLAALLISTPLVHEGGHALAAWLVGIRIVRVDLGPIRLETTASGWRVGRTSRLSSWAVYPLPSTPHRLRWRHAVLLAGGPAAVIGAGAAYLGLAAVAAGSVLRLALLAGALMSVMDGLVSLVPVGWRSVRTDGWKLLTWLTDPAVALLRVSTTTLLLHAALGERPAEWPDAWIAAGREAPPGRDLAQYATARYFAYLAARDRGRLDEAWRYLSDALARVCELSTTQGGAVLAEAALHHAWAFRDPASARALLDRVPDVAVLKVHRARAIGAIALAEGRPQAAVDASDKVLGAPDSADQPGVSVALKDWVRAVRAQAIEQLARSATGHPDLPAVGPS